MRPRQPSSGVPRFEIGGYYLDQPHRDRGGSWYACRYDRGSRAVRRRSLECSDFEQAKIHLAALVATAPAATAERGPPPPDQVLTLAVLQAYLDGPATRIASEDAAIRAVAIVNEYLAHIGRIAAPVSFWTPSQQTLLAGWCRDTYGHSAAYIARIGDVIRTAFLDAATIRLRIDAVGQEVEAALMSQPPRILLGRDAVARDLKIPKAKPRHNTVDLDGMARLLDAIETEHLFRFAVVSLCTWARPQAVIDLEPWNQVDWTDGTIDLAPVGWVETKKRRPTLPVSRALLGWLNEWAELDDEGEPKPLLIYKRQRVGCVKQAFRRIGRDVGLDGFSQYGFRHFMADQTRKLFRGVPRELRSSFLGHKVRDGSSTTDNYESEDPHALDDVALATDAILSLLNDRTTRKLFAIEVRLNRKDLVAMGARTIPKSNVVHRVAGGRDRDRTCDPYDVNVVLSR